MRPRKAFVLAAGLGTRMRPLTDDLPKPLIKAKGRTMIDRALDRLVEFGVEEVIVNVHYKPELIAQHLAARKDVKVIISREAERLETGGGILHARGQIGDEPIFVISTDIIWEDEHDSALKILADNWQEEIHGLLLLHKVSSSYGYDGRGDFKLYQDGRIEWRDPNNNAPYVFTGLQILSPQLFDLPAVHEMGKSFPLSSIYKLYLDKFRAVEYDGKWYHIGTPEALNNLKLGQA